MPDEQNTPNYFNVPPNIRTFAYLIGMLGFPVVIASYVLVVLSTDLKTLDKSLLALASRIDERPMSLDKTADFVIYATDALRSELLAGLPSLVASIEVSSKADALAVTRDMNRIQRQVQGFVRPIVRKHQRFCERFPSAGGNIGSYFVLSAPAEDVSEGDTEGYLRGSVSKDFSESLVALITNNLIQFGHPAIAEGATKKAVDANPLMSILFGQDPNDPAEKEPKGKLGTSGASALTGEDIELISRERFGELSIGSIETACTALRDQIQVKVKTQSSDFDREDNIADLRVERQSISNTK